MKQRFYLLVHIMTCRPMPLFEHNRGYTWWEPEMCGPATEVPRLFLTKRGAERARLQWVKGPTRVIRRGSAFPDDDYDEVWRSHPPERPRDVSDVAVIPVELCDIAPASVVAADAPDRG